MPAARLSSSSRLPRATSAPRAATFSAATSERASPTTSWPCSISRDASTPPMNPLAPVTNTRAIGSGGAARLDALVGRGGRARGLEEQAHALHRLGAVLPVARLQRRPDVHGDRRAPAA